MAHANPEFALACRAYRDPPLRHATRPSASLGELRARMREIGDCIRYDIPHSAEEAEAYRLWQRTTRQQRAAEARGRGLTEALAEPVGGMHGRDPRGMRFVEPKRRYPADVQAGRVKLDHRGLPS